MSLAPALAAPSPLYELQSTVAAVRETTSLPNLRTWVVTVAIGRPDPEEEPDAPLLDIELCVTEHAWRGAEPPRVGTPVEGVIWLQVDFG